MSDTLTVNEYQELANRTSAPVTPEALARLDKAGSLIAHECLAVARIAANVDEFKKFVFYGKKVNGDRVYQSDDFPVQGWIDLKSETSIHRARLVHALMGILTEVGELAEAIFNQAKGMHECIDNINVEEELGDAAWYHAELAAALGEPLGNIYQRNINKLKARYGDKFSDVKANERDLAAERKVLEEQITNQSARF